MKYKLFILMMSFVILLGGLNSACGDGKTPEDSPVSMAANEMPSGTTDNDEQISGNTLSNYPEHCPVNGQYFFWPGKPIWEIGFTATKDDPRDSGISYFTDHTLITDKAVITFPHNEGGQCTDEYGFYWIRVDGVYPDCSWWYDFRGADLNAGAGGKFIYLAASARNYNVYSGPVTSMVLLVGEYAQAPEGYVRINQDLNEGAGGNYIWLAISRDPKYGSPIRNILVENPDHSTRTNLDGRQDGNYTYHEVLGTDGSRVDLNKGAGGDYIYLYYAR